jgi:hypothetical protein
MQQRLCNRCNKWGQDSEPCVCDDLIVDLVAALQECAKYLDMAFGYEGDVFGINHNDVVDTLDAAHAAIAKAKGS